MEAIAQNIQILSEKTLRDIAKGQLVKFTRTCDEQGSVTRVWQSLFDTLSTPSLPHAQISAACNATSAFLDAAVESPVQLTRQIALSPEVWLSIFEIFITRYEDVKPKPMKQLLSSLMTILVKSHVGETKQIIQVTILKAILPCIILGEQRSRLKAALVVLEMCIRKGAIWPVEFLQLVRAWAIEFQDKWVPVFKKDYETIYPGASDPAVMSTEPSEEVAGRVFVLGLLTQTNDRGMSGTSGSIMSFFLEKSKIENPGRQMSWIWVYPTRNILLQHLDALEVLSTQIIQPLFTFDPLGFSAFIQSLPLKNLMAGDMAEASHSEYMLLFVSLQVGKKVNLVHDDYDISIEPNPNSLVLKSDVIGNFLLHQDQTIRIAALALLVSSYSTMKPLTNIATGAILRGLPSMHADCDAYGRGEIMTLTRKFITRLKSGIVTLEEASRGSKTTSNGRPSALLGSDVETRSFLQAYLQFIEHDLCVTASYARHISALKALKLLVESGLDPRTNIKLMKAESQTSWKLKLEVFSPQLLRLLIDLLLDPFEEVRQTSLLTINLFPSQVLMGGLFSPDQETSPPPGMSILDALDRAETIASNTSRADHADAVARLYHILFTAAQSNELSKVPSNWWATKYSVVDTILARLEQRISSSTGLLGSTMQQTPLHGYMSGLRYIVLTPDFHSYIETQPDSSNWRAIHNRITNICEMVWLAVKPVLCVDSPEGHTDEPSDDLMVGPKDILSYSWRSLRESSLLLHATLTNVSYGPSTGEGLHRADFENVGRLSFTQLAELRHRGAFSTVSTTFATCCQRCSTSQDPSIQQLPVDWYQEAKTTIFEASAKLTRRSAGLPALVTGVLCSTAGTPFFKQVINELVEISHLPMDYDKDQQYLKLPQVHAMNCLKDIFINNKLGPHTESFVMSALTLSAERLGSPIWNLRNSGLMLFRALLFRMCRATVGSTAGFGGVSGAEPGSKISFPKYPGLLELLSTLLAPTEGTTVEGTDIVTERIFPALELIGEKIPTSNDQDDTTLRSLVVQHFNSPVWGIREHAAKVYASLLTRRDILKDARALVDILNGEISQNYLHANILCIQYSLRRFADSTDVFWASHIDEILFTVHRVINMALPLAKSPFVATALVEIMNDTLERSFEAGIEAQVSASISTLCEKNDLQGVMSYIFDASSSGWNLASRTRASSLLRRALSWCTAMRIFAAQQKDESLNFFLSISAFDADAGNWIIERLDEKLGEKEKYRQHLVHLYSSIIVGQYTTDVRTIAVANLASSLEQLLSSHPEAVADLILPCDDLIQGFRPDLEIENWNRQATDAELRLQGCLHGVQFIKNGALDVASFKSTIYSWAVKLRSALSEETEFTTRYAAALSVQSFSRGLRPANSSPRVDDALLDIYLILYDMLNDDDDEIRDVAASTASWVLSYSSVSPNTAVALGPLNSSSLLATLITNHYSSSPRLARRVIRYLTGQEPRISGSDTPLNMSSVPALIAEYSQESTVLFVEEKQNLFIDDVREIDIWSKVLSNLSKDALPEKLVGQFSKWVLEGLEYISTLVGQPSGLDGLLGWISKPECFTLGIRVISLSCVLASKQFGASQFLSFDPSSLRVVLQTLLEAGPGASVHDEWLLMIKNGLDLDV
ncbi:uncharacterized protein N7483_008627 [Penicillium malachiteum]|uniref:uncharacterized protein n=1 Tax=Penicillium malachiteum TaxID=1324776 RepID=UPI0025487FDF|nr:uncharacterized protein N7483_008627 [Penicillium malachiteum]KAJ5720693.1 hypothetical protein N7483_008627 [Penicillium malachiteum]